MTISTLEITFKGLWSLSLGIAVNFFVFKITKSEVLFTDAQSIKKRKKKKKKKRNTPIYFNTNYHAEIKLVPIIIDYCLP